MQDTLHSFEHTPQGNVEPPNKQMTCSDTGVIAEHVSSAQKDLNRTRDPLARSRRRLIFGDFSPSRDAHCKWEAPADLLVFHQGPEGFPAVV